MRSTRGTPRLRCVPPTPARARRLARRHHPTPSMRVRGIPPQALRADPFDITRRPDARIFSSGGASSFGASPASRRP